MCFHWWDAPNKSQKQWDAFVIPSCSIVIVPQSIFQYFHAPSLRVSRPAAVAARGPATSAVLWQDSMTMFSRTHPPWRSFTPPSAAHSSLSLPLSLSRFYLAWTNERLTLPFTIPYVTDTSLLLLFIYTLLLYSSSSAYYSSPNPVSMYFLHPFLIPSFL